MPAPATARRTCTLRTRYSNLVDLEKAVLVLVRDDGRLFVPIRDPRVSDGDALAVVFTTLDGRLSVSRLGYVESTRPDPALSAGVPGMVFCLLSPQMAPAPRSEPEVERPPFPSRDSSWWRPHGPGVTCAEQGFTLEGRQTASPFQRRNPRYSRQVRGPCGRCGLSGTDRRSSFQASLNWERSSFVSLRLVTAGSTP